MNAERAIFSSVTATLAAVLGAFGHIAPARAGSEPAAESLAPEAPPAAAVAGPREPPVVEITARGMTFEAPDQISAGWITFRLKNETEMIHFALLEKLPAGRGIEDHQREVAPVFQNIMDGLNGKPISAPAAGVELPPWYAEIVFLGGPGFVSPGQVAETTLFVEPGTYLLECYVKTGGVFHSYHPSPDVYGMVHEIRVNESVGETMHPSAQGAVRVSAEGGIEIDGAVKPGKSTIAVHFQDQTAHAHFLGHDVHLVRLDEETDLEALAVWMDWTKPTGLETPAPAQFLGGTHEMPAGRTAYVTVTLEPGRYAWIAEVPDPIEKGMMKPFTVPSPDDATVD